MSIPTLTRAWPAVALIAIAALPRLLWTQAFRWLPVSDSAWYHARAVELAHGLGYSSDGIATAFFPIGYPGFLAGLFLLFPSSSATVAIANLLLGLGLVWASLLLYRELGFGETRARQAALLVALCPTLILYTTLEMSESLFTLLLVAGTDLLLLSRRRPAAALAAGVLFGAATLVRSQVVFLPAAMLALMLVPGREPRRLMRTGGMLYLAMACLVLPWSLRNWMVLGTPVPVSTNDGYNFLVGNNPWQRWGSGYPPPPELAADLARNDAEKASGAGEVAWDRRLRALGWSYVRQDPLHYLALAPRKLMRHFSFDNETLIQNDSQARAAGDAIRWWPAIIPASRLFHGAILVGCLLGLSLATLANPLRRQICFCLLPAAYFAAISAAFFAEQRFNLPALPFMIGAALLGYARLAELAAASLRSVRARASAASRP
jgi:4-amino-4-deoxy-L-arabinose transferase-like glycosyltransferase